MKGQNETSNEKSLYNLNYGVSCCLIVIMKALGVIELHVEIGLGHYGLLIISSVVCFSRMRKESNP